MSFIGSCTLIGSIVYYNWNLGPCKSLCKITHAAMRYSKLIGREQSIHIDDSYKYNAFKLHKYQGLIRGFKKKMAIYQNEAV